MQVYVFLAFKGFIHWKLKMKLKMQVQAIQAFKDLTHWKLKIQVKCKYTLFKFLNSRAGTTGRWLVGILVLQSEHQTWSVEILQVCWLVNSLVLQWEHQTSVLQLQHQLWLVEILVMQLDEQHWLVEILVCWLAKILVLQSEHQTWLVKILVCWWSMLTLWCCSQRTKTRHCSSNTSSDWSTYLLDVSRFHAQHVDVVYMFLVFQHPEQHVEPLIFHQNR